MKLPSWRALALERARALRKQLAPLRAQLRSFFRQQRTRILEALGLARGAMSSLAQVEGVFPVLWARVEAFSTPHLVGVVTRFAAPALVAGEAKLVQQVASAAVGVNFNLQNPRAVAHLQAHALERAQLIQGTSRDKLRQLLVRAAGEGWSHETTARAIRAEWTGYTRARATLIAQAELGEAYEAGQRVAAQEMQARGVETEKSWLTSRDARVTAGCRANAAAGWIPFDEPFPSGHQHPLRFPRCRCCCLYRAKGASA